MRDRYSIAAGLLLVAAGLWQISGASTATTYSDIVAGIALLGLGAGLVIPAATGSVMGSVPGEHTGVAAGTNGTIKTIAGGSGTDQGRFPSRALHGRRRLFMTVRTGSVKYRNVGHGYSSTSRKVRLQEASSREISCCQAILPASVSTTCGSERTSPMIWQGTFRPESFRATSGVTSSSTEPMNSPNSHPSRRPGVCESSSIFAPSPEPSDASNNRSSMPPSAIAEMDT